MRSPLPMAPAVLVVDDNADFVDNLREILSEAGYQAHVATTCQAARAQSKEGFKVALVDVRLPDGDGTSLAAELKAANPDAEILLLTGHGTLESATAAVRAGACAYLLKPVKPPDLLLALEQAMRQVRLHEEKRELARRTQVAEKLAAVGTLTAGLSHEIRNPLNAAALQLAVLERRVQRLPAEVGTSLMGPITLVRDEIRRLDHILEDFLSFARPVQLSPKPVQLEQLCARVVALFEEEARKREVALRSESESVPAIGGDEGRLQQVLLNLTLNALQATPKGGAVVVSCRLQQDEVVLTVEDSGPGFPPELRDRLFEPFFTTKPGGSGLGLPIVHSIITQHGGSVTAENRMQGGARFTLRFPALRNIP